MSGSLLMSKKMVEINRNKKQLVENNHGRHYVAALIVIGLVMLYIVSVSLQNSVQQTSSLKSSNHCGYREYIVPNHHQGLPFMGEVFATNEGTSVFFVALNKGGCLKEWRYAHEFHSTESVQHYFICGFPDGTKIRSDPIHVKMKDEDMDWSNAIIVIRCDIPLQYQDQVKYPSPTSDLLVDLYATEDLEAISDGNNEGDRTTGNTNGKFLPVSTTTSYQDLLVCHGEWPTTTYSRSINSTRSNKKDYLSMMTKIKLSYCPHEGLCETRILVDPKLVVAWIEHHVSIGFEHFYIYDNEETPHGILEKTLLPYIASGLVTYVWYPMTDCIVDYETGEKHIGDRFTTSQAVASTAALRRYEHRTTYMAFLDIDEYIFPPDGVTDMKTIISKNEEFDFLTLQLTWFSTCDGDKKNSEHLPFDTSLCYTEDVTPRKSIMKTSRILAFFVHFPTATVDGKKATNYKHLDDVMVAHYRSGRARDPTTVSFVQRLDVMANYRERLHERIDTYWNQLLLEEGNK
jgi:Glycosyltransferase family 92